MWRAQVAGSGPILRKGVFEMERVKERAVVEKKPEKKSKKCWVSPTIEDVSGKVMAQPYIRFT